MNAAVSVTPSIEAYLDLGLRDQWHPVLASWEVAANPVGITRLGENIVVWRDAEGQVHALEDRCPHRGARLSLGWNLGNRVACWYCSNVFKRNGLGLWCGSRIRFTCPCHNCRCWRNCGWNFQWNG